MNEKDLETSLALGGGTEVKEPQSFFF